MNSSDVQAILDLINRITEPVFKFTLVENDTRIIVIGLNTGSGFSPEVNRNIMLDLELLSTSKVPTLVVTNALHALLNGGTATLSENPNHLYDKVIGDTHHGK
jgi:hypothetical protein